MDFWGWFTFVIGLAVVISFFSSENDINRKTPRYRNRAFF
jgi:hypothetical protein